MPAAQDAGQTGPEAMMIRDAASSSLGLEVVTIGQGSAVVRMPVRADMLNGFAVVHGGFIFSVADTAFAIACNETEEMTLAAGADITFLRPATLGQTLTATAERRSRSGRSGLYDVRVTDETGAVIAEFRGRSRTLSRPVTA